MINIHINDQIANPLIESIINTGLFEEAVKKTLSVLDSSADQDLSIVLTDDEQLQQLNREFLGIDAPTDVLAFPSIEVDPDSGRVYLGDVIISYATAYNQAKSAGVPVERELCLLVIHGVLHLLGYDHTDERQKKEMWLVQDAVLNKLEAQINRIGGRNP